MGKKIKTCIIGDSSVGKTSIITRIIQGSFKQAVAGTVGIDYKYQIKTINGQECGVQLWDTSGQDKYRSIAKNFYRSSDGVFLVFSIADDSSLKGLEYWSQQLKDNLDPEVPRILLANKCDMKKEPSEQAQKVIKKLVEEQNYSIYKVSAKTGVNINQAYDELILKAYKFMKTKNVAESFIIPGVVDKKKGGCC